MEIIPVKTKILKKNPLFSILNILKKKLKVYSKYAIFCRKIANEGFDEFFDLAAELSYMDENYETAIKYWEKVENIRHKKYYVSKYKVSTNDDERIEWLFKLNDNEKILDLYKKNELNNKHLSEKTYQIIFITLLREKKYIEAINYKFIDIKIRVKRLLEVIHKLDNKLELLEILFDNIITGYDGMETIRQNLDDFYEYFNEKQIAIEKVLKDKNWKKILQE